MSDAADTPTMTPEALDRLQAMVDDRPQPPARRTVTRRYAGQVRERYVAVVAR